MFAPVEAFIGTRYIHARRGNHFIGFISLTSIVATALGVTVLLTILSIMNGFEGELRERILGLAAHLEVETEPGEGAAWRALMSRIARHAGVTGVAPYVRRDVLVAVAGGVRAVEVRGIDPALEQQVTTLGAHMRSGAPAARSEAPFRVLIGSELATALGVGPGAMLTLIVPQPAMTPAGLVPRMKRFEVAGVFEFGLQEHDGGLVLIDLADAQRLFRLGDAVDGVRVRLADAARAPAVKAGLARERGAHADAAIRDWTDTHANLFRALRIEKMVMFVILALAIGIASCNVVSILVVAVTEKRADIAMMRALGLERGGVMRVFLVQGGVTGAIGVLAGLVCGTLLATSIDSVVAAVEQVFGFKVLSPDIYYISNVPTDLRAGDFVATALVAALLGLAAPLYPAWLAASMQPSSGLRHE
jgi:lipoprotein-releasing system permease protein